jgi:hypothetical protein
MTSPKCFISAMTVDKGSDSPTLSLSWCSTTGRGVTGTRNTELKASGSEDGHDLFSLSHWNEFFFLFCVHCTSTAPPPRIPLLQPVSPPLSRELRPRSQGRSRTVLPLPLPLEHLIALHHTVSITTTAAAAIAATAASPNQSPRE